MVTVGPFPSQLLWNVDAAQPSVLACQHLTNLLRPVVWSTGSKYEINLKWYFLPWLSRMLDELRASKNEGGAHRWGGHILCTLKFPVLASLILLNSFAPFTAPSRANTYVHRRYLLENLFTQSHKTTKQGKWSRREKMSTLSSTTLSHVFRGVARICSEVRTILQKPLTPSATSPLPHLQCSQRWRLL